MVLLVAFGGASAAVSREIAFSSHVGHQVVGKRGARQRNLVATEVFVQQNASIAAAAGGYFSGGNQVCRVALKKVHAVRPPRDRGDVLRYLRATLPITERELRELHALAPPARYAAPLRAALAGSLRQESFLTTLLGKLERGTASTTDFKVPAAIQRLDGQVNANFRRAGLLECAKD
jgi:hypothetical protein